MPKLTKQDVMQKYTVRVYDKDQADLLNRAMEKFMPMIGNKTDTIRHFALIGAEKMLGDSQINNSINFSEIRRYMQGVDEKLDKIEKGQKSYFEQLCALMNRSVKNHPSAIFWWEPTCISEPNKKPCDSFAYNNGFAPYLSLTRYSLF